MEKLKLIKISSVNSFDIKSSKLNRVIENVFNNCVDS